MASPNRHRSITAVVRSELGGKRRSKDERRACFLHPSDVARPDRALDAGGGRPAVRSESPGIRPLDEGPGLSRDQSDGQGAALRHGETVVTEAAAICAYLADTFPEAGLAPPPGSRERGPYYRWFFFAAGPLDAAVTDKALGFEIPVEREGMVGYGNLERALAALEGALYRTEYIAGDHFTAADVYAGSLIGWGMLFRGIDRRPAFERYWNLVSARPAALRAKAIDDELVEQRRAAS